MIRAAHRDDLTAVVAVMNAVDVAVMGEPDTVEADIAGGWDDGDFDVTQDAFVAEDPSGTIVGYAEVYDGGHGEQLDVDVIAPPGTDEPVLRDLLDVALRRAGERSAPGWKYSTWLSADDHRRPTFEAVGFGAQRSFVRMRMELDGRLPPPRAPEGIRVRACRDGDEAAVHDVLVEAFASHARPMSPSLERFIDHNVKHPDYDPSLWSLALDGERAVGALTVFNHDDLAFIRNIGVRMSHRARGIATAMILRTLAALQERGQNRTDLGVDLDDEVDAARLYEHIGFKAFLQQDLVVYVVSEAQ